MSTEAAGVCERLRTANTLSATARQEPWTEPLWSAYTSARRSDLDLAEHGVERLIRLGSQEYGEAEWALIQFALLRPDLTPDQVRAAIDELLQLAALVIAYPDKSIPPRIAAEQNYLAALGKLAHRPDDTLALVHAVWGERVDELARKRGGR